MLSAALFAVGFLGVLIRRNTLVIYMCLELMLVAATLALVRSRGSTHGGRRRVRVLHPDRGAAEVAVGLAIIVALFRARQTVQVDELNSLKH